MTYIIYGMRETFDTIVHYMCRTGKNDFTGLYRYSNDYNMWELAPTQFNASDDDILATAYYGANGASVGRLNATKYFTNTDNATVVYYEKLVKSIYNSMDTTNVTTFTNYTTNAIRNQSYIDWLTVSNKCNYISFNGCASLQYLNISGWDLSNITNMSNMFNQCVSLYALPFTENTFNSTNVKDTSNMFRNCAIANFNVVNADFSNVVNMMYMFYRKRY